MISQSTIVVDSGTAAPLDVSSNALCANLNADLLDGQHASAFAASSHTHDADEIVSGMLADERLADGTAAHGKGLIIRSGIKTWDYLYGGDIADFTAFGVALAQKVDAAAARTFLGVPATLHTHDAASIVTGVVAAPRLGSGASSTSHVLFGNPSNGGGFWKIPAYTDVTSAVGYDSSTAYRVPYWSSNRVLANSSMVWDPTYTRGIVRGYLNLDAADIGTSGKVIATDVTVDEGNATDFKGAVYRKVKSTLTGSASVTVTANDGAQTLTLTSGGVVFGTVAATTVSSGTDAETTLLGSVRSGESKTLANGSIVSGDMFEFRARGEFTSSDSDWSNSVMRFKLGSLVLTFTMSEADSVTPTNYLWDLSVLVTVTTSGSSATVVATGRLDFEYRDSGGLGKIFNYMNGVVSGTLSTNADNVVDLTWDNVSPGGEMTVSCRHAFLRKL